MKNKNSPKIETLIQTKVGKSLADQPLSLPTKKKPLHHLQNKKKLKNKIRPKI